jgi:Glycosyltransferase family 87
MMEKPMNPVASAVRKFLLLTVVGIFVVTSLLSIMGTVFVILTGPGHSVASHDFISYWATGQQLVRHGNPYDPKAILAYEQLMGYGKQAHVLMMRNPPNALFLALPLGLLPARAAFPLWALLLAGCLLISIQSLAKVSTSTENKLYLIAYCFAPALACIATGQTGIFSLLGLSLFLRLHRQWPMLAGTALSLCAIKPHLILPFGCALIAWVIVGRTYRLLTGFFVAVAAQCAVAFIFDHSVMRDYGMMAANDGIQTEFIPTLSGLLRFSLDRHAFLIQFVPAGIACGWAIWYFYKDHRNWDWIERGPLLILVSLVVSPYAWFTDQAIALAAILPLIGKYPRSTEALLIPMSLASLAMVFMPSLHSQVHAWMSFMWIGWYFFLKLNIRSSSPKPGEPLTSAQL